jgi:hypothetical protein
MTRFHACALLACVSILAMAAPAAAATAPCHASVSRGVLPAWARTGFSDPRPRMPHTLGRAHRIAAIIFGYPLLSPPGKRRSNKILWVSRGAVRPMSDLRIRAQKMRGRRRIGRHEVRVVRGGPGPSGINLPSPGCWRLSLTWSGRTDVLDLLYN